MPREGYAREIYSGSFVANVVYRSGAQVLNAENMTRIRTAYLSINNLHGVGGCVDLCGHV